MSKPVKDVVLAFDSLTAHEKWLLFQLTQEPGINRLYWAVARLTENRRMNRWRWFR